MPAFHLHEISILLLICQSLLDFCQQALQYYESDGNSFEIMNSLQSQNPEHLPN